MRVLEMLSPAPNAPMLMPMPFSGLPLMPMADAMCRVPDAATTVRDLPWYVPGTPTPFGWMALAWLLPMTMMPQVFFMAPPLAIMAMASPMSMR